MRGLVVSVLAVVLFMSAVGWFVIGGAGVSRLFVSFGLAIGGILLLVVDNALGKAREQALRSGGKS